MLAFFPNGRKAGSKKKYSPGLSPFPWSKRSSKLMGTAQSCNVFLKAVSALITSSTLSREPITSMIEAIKLEVVLWCMEASWPSLAGQPLITSIVLESFVSKLCNRSCKALAPAEAVVVDTELGGILGHVMGFEVQLLVALGYGFRSINYHLRRICVTEQA